MKKLLLSAAVLVMTVAATAQTAVKTADYENYVQVTGKAEREVVPNEIYLQIIIDENDSKGKISVASAEKDMISALRRAGIDTEKNLSVDDMSSGFLKRNKTATKKAYQLKVSSGQQLGAAVDAIESAGVSNVKVTKSTHSDIKKIYSELRVEAMKDAQANASELAGAIGQSVGRAIFIADYNNMVRFAYNDMALSRTYKSGGSAVMDQEDAAALDFKTMKLEYQIQAKFELK